MRNVDRFADSVAHGAGRLDTFWDRLTEGMSIGQLWEEFKAEAQAGYRFYSSDVDWASFDKQRPWKRRLHVAWALARALLLKLSPARRIILLLTLAYVITSLFDQRGPAAILYSTVAFVFLLALELADRVTMKRDLEIAREIQHWLVPASPPVIDGLDIAFATRPANTVSGDYYDAFLRGASCGTVSSNRLLLVVADVAGKSIPAALLMATIQASLRTLAAAAVPLAELMLGLNRYACANSLSGARFTTAFVAELDIASRTLTYTNAGHNAPIVRRRSGAIERLEEGGVPLGVIAATRYDQGEVVLESGDVLIIFTDGVIEAENERQEEFGEPRLLALVDYMQPASAARALENIITSVDGFVGHTRQHDDITALVLLVR